MFVVVARPAHGYGVPTPMKKLSFVKKTLIAVALLAIVAGIAGSRMKDAFVRRLIVEGLRAAGGFEVTIDRLHFGIVTPTLVVEGVQVRNPTNFPVREAFQINRLFVRYDRWSLFRRSGYVPEIDLDLAKIVLVRMADGRTNLERLESVGAGGATPSAPAAPHAAPVAMGTPPPPVSAASAPPPAPRTFQAPLVRIDKLRIKIDAIDYYDYALGGSEPMVIPAQLKFDESFSNVTNVLDIVDQLQSRLDVGALMGDMGGRKPPHAEERRKKAEREVDSQIERVVEGL